MDEPDAPCDVPEYMHQPQTYHPHLVTQDSRVNEERK